MLSKPFVQMALVSAVALLFGSCAAEKNPSNIQVAASQEPSVQATSGEFLISQGQSIKVMCAIEGDDVKILSIDKGSAKEPGALIFSFSKGFMGTTLTISNCTGHHLTYDAYIKVGKQFKQTSIMGAIAGIPGFESWADSFSTLKINNIRVLKLDMPAKDCNDALPH